MKRIIQVRTVTGAIAARKAAGDFIPLRAPHHTASCAGVVAEFFRAGGGVLYLDQLEDWPRGSIDTLCTQISAAMASTASAAPLAILLDGTSRDGTPRHLGAQHASEELQRMVRKRWEAFHDQIVAACSGQPWFPPASK